MMSPIILIVLSWLCLSTAFLCRGPVRTKRTTPHLNMVFNMFSSSSKGKISSNKKLCVVTGTSSGLGKETARSLIESGDYHVVCGVRDTEKMKAIAEEYGFDKNSYSILPLDLASFDSTRQFVSKLKSLKGSRPLDSLCCNAAVYQPSLSYPKYTGDDIEEQLQINHLSHFLLCSLLINDVKKGKDPRIVIVGSITGNSNTIGGGAVLPLADLGDLQGLQAGGRKPVAMIDGLAFNGAKSYKDSKICNMMTINELHSRYHDSTGITFSSMYPGCIAETNLFREKREWFRTLFPLFMKYVTGGYVSEREAGDRLAQVIAAPECKKSGVYWSWNGGARQLPVKDFKKGTISGTGGAGGSIFENTPSDQVADRTKSGLMWDYSSKITDAKWPAVSKKRELV